MRKVTLGEVAREHKEVCRENRSSYPIVGLEHLTPEDVNLTAWSEDAENTFTKMFRKGNVLFGRRRAYLKKAAQAPFDGICSGDITVIEAIPGKIEPELLPFVIQNDQLFDFAVEKSAGSLSPRVKWEHLKNYTFNLPELAEQKKLADLLWAMDAAKQAYQRLLQKTDELVKSQFIEMFEGNFEYVKIGDYIKTTSGGTPSSKKSEYYTNGTIPWLTSGEVGQGKITKTQSFISQDGLENSSAKWIPANSVVIAMYGATVGKVGITQIPLTTNQAVCSLLPNKNFNSIFLFYACKQKEQWMLANRAGAAQPNISQTIIKEMLIPKVPMILQEQFSAFVEQSDKSKFAVLKSSNLNL